MNIREIIILLQNSGLTIKGVDDGFIYFEDPGCIYTAFDKMLDFAWIVILVLTGIMLFGWALLYIKNGTKINDVFNNAKTVILIFCVLSVTKPIVNTIYHGDLFANACETKKVSLNNIQELIEIRNKTLSKSDEDSLYEIFNMTDSGPIDIYESDDEFNSQTSQELNNRIDNFLNDVSDEYRNDTANAGNSQGTTTYSVSPEIKDDSNFDGPKSNFVRIEYGDKTTIYINAKGEKIKRTNGSVAWRNNNPGNIIKSSAAYNLGAIGATDKWAVFPDEETGLKAVVRLLRSKIYNNLSIQQAINRWAPSSDGNNPKRYAQRISAMTGVPITEKIKNLTDAVLRQVANAIKIIEGWTPGKEEKI